jgi:hypothetical protein
MAGRNLRVLGAGLVVLAVIGAYGVSVALALQTLPESASLGPNPESTTAVLQVGVTILALAAGTVIIIPAVGTVWEVVA